jgi:hypothetical protein
MAIAASPVAPESPDQDPQGVSGRTCPGRGEGSFSYPLRLGSDGSEFEISNKNQFGGFTVMNLNTEALFHPNHHFHGVQAGGMEVGRHTETASARRIRLYDLP